MDKKFVDISLLFTTVKHRQIYTKVKFMKMYA